MFALFFDAFLFLEISDEYLLSQKLNTAVFGDL